MSLSNGQYQIDSAVNATTPPQVTYKDTNGTTHVFTITSPNYTSLASLQAQIASVITGIEANITLNGGTVAGAITAAIGAATTPS